MIDSQERSIDSRDVREFVVYGEQAVFHGDKRTRLLTLSCTQYEVISILSQRIIKNVTMLRVKSQNQKRIIFRLLYYAKKLLYFLDCFRRKADSQEKQRHAGEFRQ
ncbi:MAG: hypothetical protein JSW59_04465 [Phycisphaerales bacterium]|nr:MAG: hypothetical protein JSW59_04465 [Phycisphaerales bacterium]